MKAIRLTVGIAALALLGAGCGGGAKAPTVAHLGSGTSSSSSASGAGGSHSGSSSAGSSQSGSASPDSQAVAYSACMREHGVPNFPDPNVTTNGNEVKVAVRVTPGITGNPKFNSAQKACSKLIPGGGPGPGSNHPISLKEQAEYLKAAACIRTHGIPSFPDPTFSGGGVHVSHKGLDLKSPQALKAEEACQSLIPGGLHGNH
jgi:hypothetical protein